MDREAWWATVPGVTESQTQLKQLSTHARTHAHMTDKVDVQNTYASIKIKGNF